MKRAFQLNVIASVLIAGHLTNAGTVESFDSPSNCREVRLDQGGGSFSRIPVYNQAVGSKSDTYICYAVAASMLADSYRFQDHQNLKSLSSPLSIALRTRLINSTSSSFERAISFDDSDPVTFMVGGGSVADALRLNSGKRVCDQKWLEGLVKLVNDSSSAKPVDSFLREIAGQQTQSSFDRNLIQTTIDKLYGMCSSHDFFVDIPEPKEMREPGGYWEARKILVKKLQTESLSKEDREQLVKDFQMQFGPDGKAKMFGEQINKLLDGESPRPIAVSFFYRALQNLDHLESYGGHASVIIGRRTSPDTHHCEFLVRDSYGSSCLNSKGRERYARPCENGSVWVDARVLIENTTVLTWLP